MEEANPWVNPMDKENPEIEVHSTAVRTLGDHFDYNESRDLIYNPWQPYCFPKDLKQAIRFIETHYRKSQMDRHFNCEGCKIPEHFSYSIGRTMYNQIQVMDTQLPKWREASISTPSSQQFFYF